MRSAETLTVSIIAPAFREAEGSGGGGASSQLLLQLPHVAQGDAVVAQQRHARLLPPHAVHRVQVKPQQPVSAPRVERERPPVIVRGDDAQRAHAAPPQLRLRRLHQPRAYTAALLERVQRYDLRALALDRPCDEAVHGAALPPGPAPR